MGLRYSGQEAKISLFNSTTKDQLLQDFSAESLTFSFVNEIVEKQFLGNKGPVFRTFANGIELGCKLEVEDEAQMVAFVNAVNAKAQGDIADEFLMQFLFKSPSRGGVLVTFPDIAWDALPFDIGDRMSFLSLDLKGKCSFAKIQVV